MMYDIIFCCCGFFTCSVLTCALYLLGGLLIISGCSGMLLRFSSINYKLLVIQPLLKEKNLKNASHNTINKRSYD